MSSYRLTSKAHLLRSSNLADVDNVTRRLLEFVIGDSSSAARMSEDGFSPLRKEDPQAVSDLIRLLEKQHGARSRTAPTW